MAKEAMSLGSIVSLMTAEQAKRRFGYLGKDKREIGRRLNRNNVVLAEANTQTNRVLVECDLSAVSLNVLRMALSELEEDRRGTSREINIAGFTKWTKATALKKIRDREIECDVVAVIRKNKKKAKWRRAWRNIGKAALVVAVIGIVVLAGAIATDKAKQAKLPGQESSLDDGTADLSSELFSTDEQGNFLPVAIETTDGDGQVVKETFKEKGIGCLRNAAGLCVTGAKTLVTGLGEIAESDNPVVANAVAMMAPGVAQRADAKAERERKDAADRRKEQRADEQRAREEAAARAEAHRKEEERKDKVAAERRREARLAEAAEEEARFKRRREARQAEFEERKADIEAQRLVLEQEREFRAQILADNKRGIEAEREAAKSDIERRKLDAQLAKNAADSIRSDKEFELKLAESRSRLGLQAQKQRAEAAKALLLEARAAEGAQKQAELQADLQGLNRERALVQQGNSTDAQERALRNARGRQALIQGAVSGPPADSPTIVAEPAMLDAMADIDVEMADLSAVPFEPDADVDMTDASAVPFEGDSDQDSSLADQQRIKSQRKNARDLLQRFTPKRGAKGKDRADKS